MQANHLPDWAKIIESELSQRTPKRQYISYLREFGPEIVDHDACNILNLLQALSEARKAIEEAPHHTYCSAVVYHPESSVFKWNRSCSCWKAKALNFKPEEVKS